MNNDKRIILAIAVYAAVITMVLHTLNSEGHERFISTEQSAQCLKTTDANVPTLTMSGILCTEQKCTDEDMVCSQPDIAKDKEFRTANPDSHRDEQGILNDEGRAS